MSLQHAPLDFDAVSLAPYQPHHIIAFKASVLGHLQLTDISKFQFDTSTLMSGSNHPMDTSQAFPNSSCVVFHALELGWPLYIYLILILSCHCLCSVTPYGHSAWWVGGPDEQVCFCFTFLDCSTYADSPQLAVLHCLKLSQCCHCPLCHHCQCCHCFGHYCHLSLPQCLLQPIHLCSQLILTWSFDSHSPGSQLALSVVHTHHHYQCWLFSIV